MFDLALLGKPTFTGGLVAAFGMNASLYAVLLYLVTYLQDGLHYLALGAGLRLIVITGMAIAGAGSGLVTPPLASIAFAAAVLAVILIRQKDFHVAGAPAATDANQPATSPGRA